MPLYGFKRLIFCEGCSPDGSLPLTPITQFIEDHGVSRCHVQTLLLKRALVGKKFKGRIYVAWNPKVDEALHDVRMWRLRGVR